MLCTYTRGILEHSGTSLNWIKEKLQKEKEMVKFDCNLHCKFLPGQGGF